MRIESLKWRQSLALFLCLLGVSLLVSACGSDESCSEGYYRLDGECVPIDS